MSLSRFPSDLMLCRCLLLLLLASVSTSAAGRAFPTFRTIQLTDKFWSEGVAIADLNRDGHADIIATPFWYEGPGFNKRHEIYPATQTFTVRNDAGIEVKVEGYEGALGTKEAYSDVFLTFIFDLSGDGWPDVLTVGFPGKEAFWYENPARQRGEEGRHWRQHVAFDSIYNESPSFVDLFKSGRPVLLCMFGGRLGYVRPDWHQPRQKWTFHAISAPLPSFHGMHGLGYGDIDRDGRLDVLEAEGWWQQPASAEGGSEWKFHAWSFLRQRSKAVLQRRASRDLAVEDWKRLARYYQWPYTLGGAQIYARDINGDGLPDLVSSLNAHGYGLAWFEQLAARAPSGEIRFKPHFILAPAPGQNRSGVSFTQLHALNVADIDGDGLDDIVTGKRFWAHGPNRPGEITDPEMNAPAVLYGFKLQRPADGRVEFVPYLIDDNSGVGLQVAVHDVNGDGLLDVAESNKKGAFVFVQNGKDICRER